jgi:hypothetical protein
MGLFAGGGVWMRFAAVTVTYGALARRASAVHTPLAAGLGYCCAVHALVTTPAEGISVRDAKGGSRRPRRVD